MNQIAKKHIVRDEVKDNQELIEKFNLFQMSR